MKILKRSLLAILILGVGGYTYLSWTLSDRVLFPESSLEKTKSRIIQYWGTTFEESMATMPVYEDFSVNTNDGLVLSGKYFKKSDTSTCAIIFPHGWGAMWADMLKYIPAFSMCNCDYVLYDHRVHGDSQGTYATGGIKESHDLWSVTRWVQQKNNFRLAQIGWVGSSWGAATSLIAGAQGDNVGFIIADSPFQDWYSAVFERAIRDYGSSINLVASGVMQAVNYRSGVNYKDANPFEKTLKIEEPVLLIHSKADSKTSSSQSLNISQNLNRKSWFFHTDWGNDHVMDVVNNTEEFSHLVYDFLFKEAPQFLIIED